MISILYEVSKALKKLIYPHLQEFLEESDILLRPPTEVFPKESPQLVIFLYRFEENSSMRNTEPEFSDTQKRHAPLILDCHYLFIPYAKSFETEMLLLEKLLQTFHDSKILKDNVLGETLSQTGNTAIKITSYMLGTQDLTNVWRLFPGQTFRLSASYVVSPVKIPSTIVEEFKVTKKRELDLSKK